MRKIVFLIGCAGMMLLGAINLVAQTTTCPDGYEGFLAPRLQAGGRGMVVPGGSGNRVRKEPSVTGEQVGTMSPGVMFDVLAEPYCDATEQLIWWQIESDDGLEGWTAEGLAPDDYFVEPIIAPEDVKTATPTPTRTPYPTWTPSSTPTAVPLSGLKLPELAILSPDNFAQIDVVSEIPTTGRAASLFMSPDMTHIFIVSVTDQGGNYANVYTFPELQPITQGIPLPGSSGRGAYLGEPFAMFTSDGRYMVASRYFTDKIYFYTVGEPTFITAGEQWRNINVVTLNDGGVLAVASWTGTGAEPKREWDLCFIDQFGDAYAPDDRLCLPPTDVHYSAVKFLADGWRVLVGTTEGLTIVDSRSRDVLERFHYRLVNSTLEIMPNTQTDNQLPTVLIGKEGFVLSVDLETGEERTYSAGGADAPTRIWIKPDGTQIAVRAQTATLPQILVIDLATKSLLYHDSIFEFSAQGFAYSPEGGLAYVNNELFETGTWQSLKRMRGDQHILGFSPDGTMLFVLNTTKRAFEIYGVAS